MKAARLYGPRDMRIDDVPEPPSPASGQLILKVTVVGVCGSDLHSYIDGRIGDTRLETPLILGHEFAGVVEAVGENARDGLDNPLTPGQRVAVDPATPCYRCEFCEEGHPNLCRRIQFHGLWPDDGALQERMICTARSCFPIPDTMSDAAGALLEPLGIAIHAVDLGKLRVAKSAAILGCGPIGLLILRMAKLSGADPIYAFDCFPWRAAKAQTWGATLASAEGDPVQIVHEQTGGRGVDVVFEAAWADHSVNQAAAMACLGGRVVLVGIPSDDRMTMQHSLGRRKGLTMLYARRSKHAYPRAIRLASNSVHLDDLISHRFPLEQTAEAFALNADYKEEVQKVVVEVAAQ